MYKREPEEILTQKICKLFFENRTLLELFAEGAQLFNCRLALFDQKHRLIISSLNGEKLLYEKRECERSAYIHAKLQLSVAASKKLPDNAFEKFTQIVALRVRDDPAADSACGYQYACQLRNVINGCQLDLYEDFKNSFKQKRVRMICLQLPESSVYSLKMLQEQIQTSGKHSYTLRDQEYLWIVSFNETEQQIHEWIKPMIEKYGCLGGISDTGSSFSALAWLSKQAGAALEIAKNIGLEKRYADYSDVAVFHMLQQIRNPAQLSEFCAPEILNLMNYDRLHKTFYVDTLESYLNHNCKCRDTAEKLYISESTMHYRIERIREITKMSFEDMAVIARAKITISIMHYLKGREQYAAYIDTN